MPHEMYKGFQVSVEEFSDGFDFVIFWYLPHHILEESQGFYPSALDAFETAELIIDEYYADAPYVPATS